MLYSCLTSSPLTCRYLLSLYVNLYPSHGFMVLTGRREYEKDMINLFDWSSMSIEDNKLYKSSFKRTGHED